MFLQASKVLRLRPPVDMCSLFKVTLGNSLMLSTVHATIPGKRVSIWSSQYSYDSYIFRAWAVYGVSLDTCLKIYWIPGAIPLGL